MSLSYKAMPFDCKDVSFNYQYMLFDYNENSCIHHHHHHQPPPPRGDGVQKLLSELWRSRSLKESLPGGGGLLTYVCMKRYTSMSVYIYIYMHTYIHVCIYIYICIYT